MSIPYRITPTSITLVLKGVTHILTKDSHPNYDRVREAIKAKEFDTLETLINIPKAIEQFGQGKVKVVDGVVYYGDYAIHNTLTHRMMEQMGEGFDIKPMATFLENLMQNPSKRAVDELYDFLEACDLPITEDGHFVAYKKVKADFKDIYTGTIDHSVGKVVEMPRNMVDEEKSRTCSAGLHFCSQSYLPHYGSSDPADVKYVIVKINPADVVAIPADYKNAKGRTCRYEVISEIDPSQLKFYTKSVYQAPAEEWADVAVEEATEAEVTTTATQAVATDEPMTVRAARHGFVKNGLVPVTYDDELTVHTHDNMPEGAVMRSYETKSVRKAVKAAVEALEAQTAAVQPPVAYEIYLIDEYGDEDFEVKLWSLVEAIEHADEIIEEDVDVYHIQVRKQDGDVVYDRYNRNYAGEASSSSEDYLEESSSEDYDDEEGDEPVTPAPAPAPVAPQDDQGGTLFTRAQASTILGVTFLDLAEMLEAGDKVEPVGDLVRFKK